MSARPVGVVSAMVNDRHDAIESVADGVGGADIGGHVLVLLSEPTRLRLSVSIATAAGFTPSGSCARIEAISAL